MSCTHRTIAHPPEFFDREIPESTLWNGCTMSFEGEVKRSLYGPFGIDEKSAVRPREYINTVLTHYLYRKFFYIAISSQNEDTRKKWFPTTEPEL
jgi:hypothetical protein